MLLKTVPVLFFLFMLIPAPLRAQTDAWLETDASHAIIYDYGSGTVLFEKNAREKMPPASMSKLMTLAVLFDALEEGEISLDTPFYVSKKAWQTGGSKMWVLVNTTIRVEDLIRGIAIQSGNDACIVVAENLTAARPGLVTNEDQLGSEAAFVERMNEKAAMWGLSGSSFANPTGLPDPGQRMTAYDLAKLTAVILTDYPQYAHYFGERSFTWTNIEQENRNPLLKTISAADGMKTGHTDEAGYGVVGTAEIDGQRRIIVLNGLADEVHRSREATRMMEHAFDDFVSRRFFSSGDIVGEAPIFMGKAKTVPLKVKNDVHFLLHKSLIEEAHGVIKYEGPLKAPVRAEQAVGVLEIFMPGGQEYEYPLYTAAPVREVGFTGKIGLGLEELLTPPDAGGGD